ncbi:sulfuric ester hydrolase [Fragilaria crotonensis]|nr:sulfuric ester hydrolase [Fragilaria crotonensis]
MEMVSSLDIVPTILSILGQPIPDEIDGIDISTVLFKPESSLPNDRALFFWRDGFSDGPLPAPFGRFDVAAIKIGRIKAWLWTKSGHYNDDPAVYHDPPLLFDVIKDPAEAFPLDPNQHTELISQILQLVADHKASIPPAFPLALHSDPKFLPCFDKATECRTPDGEGDIK